MTDGQSEACRALLEERRQLRIKTVLRTHAGRLSIADLRWLYCMAFGYTVEDGDDGTEGMDGQVDVG